MKKDNILKIKLADKIRPNMTHEEQVQVAKDNTRVLAISPYTDGFGYAVFDAPYKIRDWGVSKLRCNKLNRVLNRFEMLLKRYAPNIVAVQLPSNQKNNVLAKKIISALSKRCAVNATPFKRFKREDISNVFSQFDAVTKETIADKLVELLPELKGFRPGHRAIWEREHTNMKIFDAASLALTLYSGLEDIMNLPQNRSKLSSETINLVL